MHIIKKSIVFYLLIILFIINIPISTQAIELMFYNMTVSDGLSQTTVKTIFQDSNGYMWIGTTDGLNKYNGFEFDVYNKSLDKDKTIISGHIYCLNEDLDKNLWIGTSDGISTLNLETNKIVNYSTNNSSLPSNKIKEIKVDNYGNVIIATLKGLVIYDKEKDDFISLIDDSQAFTNIFSIELYNNEIYAISPNCFFKYDIELNKYTIIDNVAINRLSENDSFTDISLYKDKIYIGTSSKGVYVYNIKTNTIDTEYSLPISDNTTDSNAVSHIFNDGNNLWIGTDNGIYISDQNGILKRFSKCYTDKYSLANNNVQYITQDSSGLMWIGTYSGLSTVDYNAGTNYINDFSCALDINTNIVLGGYEDTDGKLYLGLYGNGLSILDNNSKDISYINTETPNKLSSNNIWDVRGNEKYVFVATEKGLNILNKDTLEVKLLSKELSSEFINTLFIDGDKLWLGVKGGFDIVDLNDFTVTSISPLLKSNNICIGLGSTVYKDSKGIYWLGSANKDGLVKFDPSNDSMKLYQYNEKENSISDNTIISIAEDTSGNMWFGTESGLNKYNRETEEFKSYSMKDGLSNNTIYSIITYDNYILVSTNRGINCLSFNDDKIDSVKKYFIGTEFNSNSALKLNNGNFAFGAVDGLYTIDSSSITNKRYIPKLKFDCFKVNGLYVDTLENESISYKGNSICIKLFTTLYSSTENVQFYYRITKDDKDWTLINNNKVSFSNLASGKYDIEFKAVSSNGLSSDIETISFKVQPPFWRNPFVQVLYLLIIIMIIICLCLRIRYMNIAIRVRNHQLSKEMKAKNELLLKNIHLEKRKNNYLINMSHELRTPLNVIYSIHQLIIDFNKKGPLAQHDLKKYMDMSSSNIKRLLKIINDLIDSTKIDEGSYNLIKEEKDIIYVIEEAALSLKNLIEEKGIDLIIDTDMEECIMTFDENAIERCIVNIVNNAYKFTESGGEIIVNIIDLYSVIRIDISDTGSGLTNENISTIFDRFNQVVNSKREISDGSGLGLTITKRLVKLHNGHILVKSEIGKGSTFTIVLPKNIKTSMQ